MDATLDSLWKGSLAAFIAVATLTPLLKRVWMRVGRPDTERSLRKVHAGEVPRSGGVVLLVTITVIVVWGFAGKTDLSRSHRVFSLTPLTGVLAGAVIAGLAGLYDDLVGLRPRYKLLAQLTGAVVALSLGLEWPAMAALLDHNWVSLSFTAAFLVMAVNAVNLIDGLDGLAGGIVAIGLAVVVGSAVAGTTDIAVGWVAAVSLGGVLGFLLYNRHPARVFMGDSGSFFLGFLLVGLLLFVGSVRPRKPIVHLSIPLMVLAVPLLDMGLAILRRLTRGQRVFSGDADHVHHRLLARGFSQWKAVGLLWTVAGLMAIFAYLTVRGTGGSFTLGGAVLAVAILPVSLGYHRMFMVSLGASDREQPWLDRRRQMTELLRQVARSSGDVNDAGVQRWKRVAPELQEVLEAMGITAYEVRKAGELVVSVGEGEHVRAWLALPLSSEAELRLSVAGALAGTLRAEQQHLIEQVIDVLAGADAGSRQLSADAPAEVATQPPAAS